MGILRGILSVVGGRFGVLLAGILTTPIIVRLLGTEGYGDYAVVTAILAVLLAFTGKDGVSHGSKKFIVEKHNRNRWQSDIFAFYFHLSLFLSVLGAVLISIAALSGIVASVYGEQFVIYAYFVGALIITEQFFTFFRATLFALGAEEFSEFSSVVQKGLYGISAIGLIYSGWGVEGALSGRLVGALIPLLICVLLITRYIDLAAIIRPRFKDLPRRDLLSFNFASMLLVLLSTTLYQVDILLLQPLAGSEQTGYYRAALIIAEFLWFAPHAVQIAILHSMSELWDQGESQRISEITSRVTRYTILFTLLLLIGISALAEPFVTLYYGEDFTPAIIPLLLLLPGALGFSIARPIKSAAQASGRMRHLLLATGSAAAINLVLNLLLIPQYGMYGAGVATSIAYGSMAIFHNISARRVGFNPLRDLRLKSVFATTVVGAAAIYSLAWLLTPSLVSLVIVPPVGLVVFAGAAVIFGAISDEEVEELRHLIGSRL